MNKASCQVPTRWILALPLICAVFFLANGIASADPSVPGQYSTSESSPPLFAAALIVVALVFSVIISLAWQDRRKTGEWPAEHLSAIFWLSFFFSGYLESFPSIHNIQAIGYGFVGLVVLTLYVLLLIDKKQTGKWPKNLVIVACLTSLVFLYWDIRSLSCFHRVQNLVVTVGCILVVIAVEVRGSADWRSRPLPKRIISVLFVTAILLLGPRVMKNEMLGLTPMLKGLGILLGVALASLFLRLVVTSSSERNQSNDEHGGGAPP